MDEPPLQPWAGWDLDLLNYPHLVPFWDFFLTFFTFLFVCLLDLFLTRFLYRILELVTITEPAAAWLPNHWVALAPALSNTLPVFLGWSQVPQQYCVNNKFSQNSCFPGPRVTYIHTMIWPLSYITWPTSKHLERKLSVTIDPLL